MTWHEMASLSWMNDHTKPVTSTLTESLSPYQIQESEGIFFFTDYAPLQYSVSPVRISEAISTGSLAVVHEVSVAILNVITFYHPLERVYRIFDDDRTYASRSQLWCLLAREFLFGFAVGIWNLLFRPVKGLWIAAEQIGAIWLHTAHNFTLFKYLTRLFHW